MRGIQNRYGEVAAAAVISRCARKRPLRYDGEKAMEKAQKADGREDVERRGR